MGVDVMEENKEFSKVVSFKKVMTALKHSWFLGRTFKYHWVGVNRFN